jgi:hypothetical protein
MSQLFYLSVAVQKLEAAEEALLDARRAFRQSRSIYDRLDAEFEVVGDAASVVKYILGQQERLALEAAQEAANGKERS